MEESTVPKATQELLPEIHPEILSEIIAACKNVTTDPADLILYSFDATRVRHMPECVAFPESTDEVSALLKVCTKYKIPVTPRGAGTGFTGASIPLKGGLVIALTRMKKILLVNEEALYCEVEPGVINYDLGKEIAKLGLFYPPDPASMKSSTIGGNVMTGAGGPSAIKYGVTRDYVMGLTAVLADGSVINTGIKTEKGVVGYDLTRLFVGSEGTLGIITKIRLKLIPLPSAVVTANAVFVSRKDAIGAVSKILHARLLPRTLEYIDRTAIRCAEEYLKEGLPVDAGAILLIETDGDMEAAIEEMNKIREVCAKAGAREFHMSHADEDAQKLWKVRRSISAALTRLRPTKINEDVTVPRNRIADLMERLDEISKKTGLPIINFGHAGDGNIHVNVMTDAENKEEYGLALKTVDEIMDVVLELDGTISGEHGVGIAKIPYIAKELGENAIELSKRLKSAFDPLGIMNPGKIFP
ncbi:MAG: FAD-linked oxidase C-terminal domain-containing protein [Nitrospinota bacterium]